MPRSARLAVADQLGASMRSYLFALIVTSLASLFITPAYALRANTYVASTGTDSGACSYLAPCRNFTYALGQVQSGGTVTALDSAGYSPFTINKAVTITAPPGVTPIISAGAGGVAITITAQSTDNIVLSGLNLNGAGVAYNGIVFNSGGSLMVADCVLQNFFYTGDTTTGNGIILQPTSGTLYFTIKNTIAVNNGNTGFYYFLVSGSPIATGVIDHFVATNNSLAGISVFTDSSGGSTILTVSNSVVGNSPNYGMFLKNQSNKSLLVTIDNVSATGNLIGIDASFTAKVLLSRSAITGNGTGISNQTSSNTFFTYKDNRINENTADFCIGGNCIPLNTALALQ
jgi:hypothetical protein